jgi:hypothetical protein
MQSELQFFPDGNVVETTTAGGRTTTTRCEYAVGSKGQLFTNHPNVRLALNDVAGLSQILLNKRPFEQLPIFAAGGEGFSISFA